MSRASSGAAVVALLTLCSAACSRAPDPQGGFRPGVLPATAARERRPFDHIVVVIQENRSFDDFFATFPGADGATWGRDHTGRRVRLRKSALGFENLAHTHFSFKKEYDGGRMDGFDLITRVNARGERVPAGRYAYRYVDPAQIAPYWTMARQYVLADHMFQTQSSGSFTAHQDLIAGGTRIAPGENVIDFPTHPPWGCDAPAGTVTSLITSRGRYLRERGPFPCFDYPTLRDLLDAKGLSWKYFTPPLDRSGRNWDAFDAIRAVRYGSEWHDDVISPQTKFFRAIDAGNLPALSWVVPDALDSDHPGEGRDTGPSWVANVVNAIGESPYWSSSAIVIVWDDWGGEFDHVAPPQIDAQGLGFRVPCLIVSPYARIGYVSHTQYEFGSLLRFIEDNWGLGRLGDSDARSKSIVEAFDFNQAPRAFVPIRSKYRRAYFERRAPSGLPVDTE
ncbi:MAG: alkaline phosphatase family protein [Candidatus Baltobacteraceae bacterium]